MRKMLFTTILIVLATMLVLPICAAAEGEAQYISAVELVAVPRDNESAMRDSAIAALNEKGCECHLDYDFNKYSKGDYVMLGYSRTDDESEAIRSLGTMAVRRGETAPATFMVDDIEYRLASSTDFNSGTDFAQVYLYYSTDTDAGSPLKELYAEDDFIEPDPDTYPRILVSSSDGKEGELDYHEVDGCDGRYENHCYLYRDYDKDYYKSSEDNPNLSTVIAEAGTSGSVFNDGNTAIIAISIGLVVLLCGAVVAIAVEKHKAKK